MDVNLAIRLDDFNGAIEEMQRRLGSSVPKRRIVDHEVGRILEKTLSKVTAASRQSIANSVHAKEWITYPSKADGGGPGKRYKFSNRYPDRIWQALQAQMARSLQRKVAAIGWSRKSWLAIAWAIGVKIKDKGAAKAQVVGHTAEENISTARDESGGNYILTIENHSPLIQWSDGRQAFFSAVAGRVNYFRQNVAHGVFDDLSAVSAKYPGFKVGVPAPSPDLGGD